VDSSPDNDGTAQHCQMGRVRLARWEGVREEPVSNAPQGSHQLEPGGSGLDCIAQPRPVGAANFRVGQCLRQGGHGEGLRRSRGDGAGAKLGADPIERMEVNVGTVRRSPAGQSPAGRREGPLPADAAGRGGGPVVVRGRESRPHGEGAQCVRSINADRGGRR
jgi:hypothetical protein